MALIRCSECGKEISDQAYACINCGCPVSKMKAHGTSAGARPLPRMKKVPTEIPEMKLLPGVLVQIIGKLDGVLGLAGFSAIYAVVVNLLSGDPVELEMLPLGILGILVALLLAELSIRMQAAHVKKYLRKNGYEPSIRNDDSSWTNSINAYKLYPSMPMAKYIRKLNPYAGDVFIDTIKKQRAETRKERLRRVPYFLILMVVYYLVPRLEEAMYLPYESSLIICHIVTLVVMMFFGRKKDGSFGVIVAVAVLFAPVIFAYYYSDMWYHIAICAVAALVGLFMGIRLRKK